MDRMNSLFVGVAGRIRRDVCQLWIRIVYENKMQLFERMKTTTFWDVRTNRRR